MLHGTILAYSRDNPAGLEAMYKSARESLPAFRHFLVVWDSTTTEHTLGYGRVFNRNPGIIRVRDGDNVWKRVINTESADLICLCVGHYVFEGKSELSLEEIAELIPDNASGIQVERLGCVTRGTNSPIIYSADKLRQAYGGGDHETN